MMAGKESIMNIEYIHGDLLGGEPIVAHGCNTRGAFGSGVAGLIRKRIPSAYQAYADAHRRTGLELGSVIWHACAEQQPGRPRAVLHMMTQPTYGVPFMRHVDYDAVRRCIGEIDAGIVDFASTLGVQAQVGFPLVGAGLGGGDWQTIAGIIEAGAVRFLPRVYLLDGRIPGGL